MRLLAVALLGLVSICADAQDQGRLLFQLPRGEEISPKPLRQQNAQLVQGRNGKALRFGDASLLEFPTEGNLDRARGTVCLWLKLNWDAAEPSSHALFSDDRKFEKGNNSLTLWEWHVGLLRFDVRDDSDQYLTADVKGWVKGEWHHVAAAWDCQAGSFLFVDGDLKASKRFTWAPKPSQTFQFGCARGGQWPADADIEDVRIYNCVLTPGQVRHVMSGSKIQPVQYVGLECPDSITVGEEFESTLLFETPEELEGECKVVLILDSTEIGHVLPRLDTSSTSHRARIRTVVPAHLYFAPGKHRLRMEITGAFGANAQRAEKNLVLRVPPHKSVSPALSEPRSLPLQAETFLAGGRIVGREEALRSVDAVPVRLVDDVDCAKTDHGYWENSPATVEEIAGTRFRCVGPQDKVTRLRKRNKHEAKELAAFSYRLKVVPRPTPHLLVIESVNDAERYLEVAVDHPRDSAVAPHLLAAGTGDPTAIHLSVTYTGREYAADGKTFRQAFMIFPKSDVVEVMISGTARANWPEARPAAVSRMWMYEVAASLGELANPILEPEGQPKRTVSIFFPAINLLFEKYGFADTGAEMRAQTLRLFMDYMRFMGLNRFELRPFQLGPRCYFKTDNFEQAGDLDFFAEALPIMKEAGVACVPRVMYLHSYHKLLQEDEDNFQWATSGKIMGFGREGPLPDPLRPQTQKIVLDSIAAMLGACKGYDNVPEVGFDTSIGGLYGWEFRDPSSLTGYSKWDMAEFAKETGVRVPDDLDTPARRHEWVKANCWQKWIQWRCVSWGRFISRIRDLVAAEGKKLELSVRIMPREEFQTERISIRDIYLQTGYDAALFRSEPGIIMDYFIRINSDRYFGRPWWKPWFYDSQQLGLFDSPELRHAELYFNYWEIPWHPWGFRVGPGSPVGRNFFEPITYLLRNFNPCDLTFFNWFAGTIGREFEVREFCRVFRALPAVAPRDFDGTVLPAPADEGLWIKWFGDRLAVVNDSPQEREVTLRLPNKTGRVADIALGCLADARPDVGGVSVRLRLRAFDTRALVLLPQ